MKKLFTLLMALMLVFGLVGCNKDNTTTTANTTDPSKIETEITWWAYPTFATVDDTAGKYEQMLVDKFNEKFPNIKVNVEMIDFKNGPEKTITALEGGTGPDVLFDAPGRIVDYGTSGYLVDLTDMVKETGLKDDTSAAILESCSDQEGHVWMYPTSAAPFVMAVSKTALEKEGLLDKLNLETRSWTTDEFIEISKEMAAKGYKGVQVYCGGQGGDQGTRSFVSNLTNATIMTEDRTKYNMDSPEGIEAYKLVKQGVDEGWLEANTAGVANDALEAFTTPQNSTFWAINLWSPNLHKARQSELDASGVEAIAMNMPAKDGNPKLEYLVNGYAIFDNKDEAKIIAAKEFVKFLADDPEVGKETVKATNCFPVRNSFGNLYEGDKDMEFYASMSQYYGPYYNTVPGFATMRPFWFGSLQAMLSGEKTPEDSAMFFNDEANKTLAE